MQSYTLSRGIASGIRVVIESKVPYVMGVFESAGATVDYIDAPRITPDAIAGADALITRTRTRCDAALLAGSRCSIVATATIGTDHIDLDWCRRAGIAVANAPGCNAPAVAQYVLCSILARHDWDIDAVRRLTIGIVGVGHVGSIVARWARSLGMRTLLCDPPRAEREGSAAFCTLERIASEADVVTVHVPLTSGNTSNPTRHMLDSRFFDSLERAPIIINSARGPVVDTPALVTALDSGQVSAAVIDCWEGEPSISPELLRRAFIATPHIAGYSSQGKLRASRMAVDAVTAHFGLPHLPLAAPGEAPAPPESVTAADLRRTYDPLADTAMLKSAPGNFEHQRDHYPLRDEPFASDTAS